MELTGKCREDFLEWWYDHEVFDEGWDILKVHDSLKWGVLVDFFAHEGTHIGNDGVNSYWIYRDTDDIEFEDLENRTEAIKKANEIYNA